jgi:DNA-binding MarR family transcriptional regulator
MPALVARKRRAFVKGPLPLDWFERAAKCSQSAVILGLLLFFKHGLGHQELSLSTELAERYSISESTKRRTLRKREAAGLIRMVIKGRKLRVELVF